jgi:hypothetical protein
MHLQWRRHRSVCAFMPLICPPGWFANNLSSLAGKDISLPSELKSVLCPRRPASIRGALRDRHERWVAGCGGRGDAQDEAHRCGRRSRVVLTPRRWRSNSRRRLQRPAGDGDNKARSPGRARRKPLKPSRGEGRMIRAHLWSYPRAYYHCTGPMGAAGTRSSLRPPLRVALRPPLRVLALYLRSEIPPATRARFAQREGEVMSSVIANEAKQSISPQVRA